MRPGANRTHSGSSSSMGAWEGGGAAGEGVVIVYLLLDYVGRSNPGDDYAQRSTSNPCPQEQQREPWTSPKRRTLSVKASENQAGCVPQTISPGQCSDDAGGVLQRPQQLRRETCAFDLEEDDIVFGVWHSLATEARLQPLLDTWGTRAQVVLLASSVGVQESKLFKEGVPGSRPHLLDTGVEQDDYFSTLGKAFVGLRLMLDAYPSKKWFVVLGDDNYVLLANYVNVLSAFDPDQPWALSRIVPRQKFGCKVAGGAGVVTSRAMTRELSPHLEPWYRGIVERSGGDVKKAREEDKFHDISFQKLVESVGHSWIHLEEFPHEPPGYYFDPRLGLPKAGQLLQRSALFHYVPGGYMHYLHFLSSNACTCSVTPAESSAALGEVAIGVYSATRRLSKLDEKRIGNTWGNGVPQYALLKASGKGYPGVKGDVTRLHELREAFPDAPWLLLLPVEHFVVTANLAKRMRALEADNVPGKRALMVYGLSVEGKSLRNGESTEALPGDGALLVGEDLVKTIFDFEEPLIGGVFPYRQLPGDRGVVEFCRTISWPTVVEDPGFVRRLPGPEWTGDAGCPATFPMDPDLADLKPEFTMSEGDAAMAVAKFLLGTAGDRECVTRLDAPTKID
eukprot:jgi/Undpi1/11124/HiC_scaffold_30.g13422.m1